MPTTKQISIFIAEDHIISRMGLKMLLEQTCSFNVIGEAEDGEVAVQKCLELMPEVVIMDLDMPKLCGVDATTVLKQKLPQTKILIFTSSGDDANIFAALKAGADGYCLKTISAEMLAIAINSVLNGAAWLDPGIAHKVLRAQDCSKNQDKPELSEAKLKLLLLLKEGKSVDDIASEFNVSDVLVKGLLHELILQLKGAKDSSATAGEVKTKGALSVDPGEFIAGHYRIEERIGAGAMGAVYKATHTLIERTVAIKILHETCGQINRERFKKEAKANAALVHQNLATIFEFGVIDEHLPYLVMEYLEGKSLNEFLKEGPLLNKANCVAIFSQVCDALYAIHSSGIVHRDLKPSNIMIMQRKDGSFLVKLVDFGIAKLMSEAPAKLTATGELIGTPSYMSPEQCKSDPHIDYRSDLYSLGCTMYAALTGCPPFRGCTPMETCIMHLFSKPDPQPLRRAKVPKKLSNLIMQLLEKGPDCRPASAAEVKNALLNS